MYKAVIYFDTEEDDYNEGLNGKSGTSWVDSFESSTKEGLREQITDAVYCDWKDVMQDNANEYENQTEYWADYLANENNEGEATPQEVKQWKDGNLKLWSVRCHILVSEVKESKVLI